MSPLRPIAVLLMTALVLGVSPSFAQPKKGSTAAVKAPGPKDRSISVSVFMRDASKNEVLVATRIWPDSPEYTSVALQRFFATMKALEPQYKQDDDVAYTWAQKGRVAKCSIYLESADAGVKNGTGAFVGCEANGVSGLVVPSGADPNQPSASDNPKHIGDVMDMFKKQSDRARANLPK